MLWLSAWCVVDIGELFCCVLVCWVTLLVFALVFAVVEVTLGRLGLDKLMAIPLAYKDIYVTFVTNQTKNVIFF